jgi:hypothetical protein|tara:strand:- start:258 stop:707 length:450 start_codon:yes stop_codon:yes gene_type:complete
MGYESKRGILLASFLTTNSEDIVMEEVQKIVDQLELTNNMIFLLEDIEQPENKILTYNIVPVKGQPYNKNLFTMRVHRKKQTNSLYTINALNQAIALEHDGQTGKHLKLSWENYSNSVMLSVKGELRVVPIKVAKIFKIEEPPADSPEE